MLSFRPLTGITASLTFLSPMALRSMITFPTPYGDYSLSDHRRGSDSFHWMAGFRPLTGITASLTNNPEVINTNEPLGFRPLTEGRRINFTVTTETAS